MTKTIAGDRGQEQPIAASRRGSQRTRIYLSASLTTTARSYAVTLRSLSVCGAMVEAPELPQVGRSVLLKRDDIDVLATVAWSEPGRCGLEFMEVIDEAVVIQHLEGAPEPTWPVVGDYFWRLREGGDRVSAEEWQGTKESATRLPITTCN